MKTLSPQATDELVSGMQQSLSTFLAGLHRERGKHGERREITMDEINLATRIYQMGYAAGFRKGIECLPCVTR